MSVAEMKENTKPVFDRTPFGLSDPDASPRQASGFQRGIDRMSLTELRDSQEEGRKLWATFMALKGSAALCKHCRQACHCDRSCPHCGRGCHCLKTLTTPLHVGR